MPNKLSIASNDVVACDLSTCSFGGTSNCARTFPTHGDFFGDGGMRVATDMGFFENAPYAYTLYGSVRDDAFAQGNAKARSAATAASSVVSTAQHVEKTVHTATADHNTLAKLQLELTLLRTQVDNLRKAENLLAQHNVDNAAGVAAKAAQRTSAKAKHATLTMATHALTAAKKKLDLSSHSHAAQKDAIQTIDAVVKKVQHHAVATPAALPTPPSAGTIAAAAHPLAGAVPSGLPSGVAANLIAAALHAASKGGPSPPPHIAAKLAAHAAAAVCKPGFHFHPTHPKADLSTGCMADIHMAATAGKDGGVSQIDGFVNWDY